MRVNSEDGQKNNPRPWDNGENDIVQLVCILKEKKLKFYKGERVSIIVDIRMLGYRLSNFRYIEF